MSAPYIIPAAPLQLLTYTIDNPTLQTITAGNEINIFAATGYPFVICNAAAWYTQATTNFSLTAGGVSMYLNYRTGGDIAAVYQDTLSGTGFLKIDPGNAVSFLCNYDPTAPNFGPQFNDSEINIGFDGDYQAGDGQLTVYLWGLYLYP